MVSLSAQRRKVLGSFALAGAWFFIVVSLLHLLFAVVVKLNEPASTFKMYHAIVGDVSYDAWAMTYTGVFGLLVAMGQTLLVSAAAVASVLPQHRLLKWRRIGHGVLTGWAALWLLNLGWLFTVDPALNSFAQASLLCLLFGCTVARAVMGWSPGRSTMTPYDSAGGDEVIDDAPSASFEPPADQASPPDAVARSRGTAMEPVPSWVSVRLKRCETAGRGVVTTARRGTAHGLNRVADFARKQASRLSPTTGE